MKIFKRILIILILVSISIYLYNKNFVKKIENDVEINLVTKEDLIFDYTFQGKVVSKKEVLIYSNLQGDVKKVYSRLGDEVKKDDILLEIDESSLTEVRNSITKAKLNLDKAYKKYNDNLELYKIGHISKSELDDIKDNLTITKLDYEELILKSKEITNKIKSSVSGTIIESNVDENLKLDQSKYLYKIVDTENLKIIAEIPNSKISNFKIGSDVKIFSKSLKDDNEIIGKVSEISKISSKSEKFNDAVTKISIDIPINSGLKPGELIDAEIIFNNLKDVLVINYIDLMVDDDGNKYVYIVNENNKVEKRNIKVGINNNIKYEIKEGLSENDRVINNLDNKYKEGDSFNEVRK